MRLQSHPVPERHRLNTIVSLAIWSSVLLLGLVVGTMLVRVLLTGAAQLFTLLHS